MSNHRHFLLALLALLAFSPSGDARAGVLSGQDLLDLCEPSGIDPVYRLKVSECTGYIIGVADSFDCKNKMLGFTWDSTMYAEQRKTIEAVLEWLHFHPNVLHYQASGLVASALSSKYPCPDSMAAQ